MKLALVLGLSIALGALALADTVEKISFTNTVVESVERSTLYPRVRLSPTQTSNAWVMAGQMFALPPESSSNEWRDISIHKASDGGAIVSVSMSASGHGFPWRGSNTRTNAPAWQYHDGTNGLGKRRDR